ncbi:MAG TPA: hypothetical protein VMB73_23835 [Acetobacteraceae bacterium]|nr:hypothetical protein [Acetobacteraceae bacterium]
MIAIEAEQEHYCLLRQDGLWAVAERRAGKYYALGNRPRLGVALDQPEAAVLFFAGPCFSEAVARRRLAEIATEWRHIYEHLR